MTFRAAPILALALALAGPAATARTPAPKLPLVGFYVPWDPAARASLRRHARRLDVFAPMWAAVDAPNGALRWQADPEGHAALAAAPRPPSVMPVVSNAHDDVWDTPAGEGVVLDPRAGEALIGELTRQATAQGFAGYVLDLEALGPQAAAAYPAFLARLRAALRPLGRQVWVTTPLGVDADAVHRLAEATDAVVLMAYDQCWATATPGPIAGVDWLAAQLDAKLAGQDPGRYVIALGAYGYDWPQGRPATAITAPAAARLARETGQAVTREPPALNPHFAYHAPDGQAHVVWFLDGPVFRAQRAQALARRVRAVAIWRLGLEDEAVWAMPSAASAVSGPKAAAPAAAPCGPLPH